MKKRYKLTLTFIVCLIVLIFVILLISFFKVDNNNSYIKSIDSIDGYDYVLNEKDTDLIKNEFKDLKKILSSKQVDYKEYAQIISKLFIINLFTIDNKINKYDVGGVEYVVPSARENFKLNVSDTIYKYVTNIDDENREKYSEVKNINIINEEESTYSYKDNEYDAYVITLSWEYIKDYGYDKEGIVTLIKDDNKIYVVKYEGVNKINDQEN